MSPRKTASAAARRAWGGSASSAPARSASRRTPVDHHGIEAALHEPSNAQPDAVLQLQRLGGNEAVRELLAGHGIQASLRVGAADDAYEQEADRVAGAVASQSTVANQGAVASAGTRAGGGSITPAITPLAQRHKAEPKPGEEQQDEDDDTVQRSSDGRRGAGFEAGSAIEATLDRTAGTGRPLGAAVQREMGERFGTDFMSLIAHEVGHAIEGYLPIQSWHDMNLLLERRHEDKVRSSRAARTGATMWTSGVVNFGPLENEGRYAGTYATGKYTSTAYDDGGNAEVFSQAIEFLSSPTDALKLIDSDPQHAAIVLRAIRPREYGAADELRKYDKYLPSKGGGG